ncbi:MAG: hypothetical protein V2I43_10260 [Parvularcula sp.]|jgi:hypothetical protein|nr:hypothetical protein [Parvularcula sp.]
MEGYQFARMETYSIQGAPGSRSHRKNGQRAWTAEEVIQEAERNRLASLHVPAGGPPPEILPGSVHSFADVRAALAKAAAVREPYLRKQKDGSVKKAKRKLRSDARTLYSSVVSLPALSKDALADPVLRKECVSLIEAAMEHERATLARSGGELLMGVIHWDEEHVHAHFLAVAPQAGRVDCLHPGRMAKEAFNATCLATGETDRKAIGRGANRAYRDAMMKWQDDFYDAVFDKAGLLRYGPKRHRLSRAEYQKAKAFKASQAEDARRSKALEAEISDQRGKLSAILREADETSREISRRTTEIQKERIDLLVREHEVSGIAAKAKQEIERAESVASSATEWRKALRVGMKSIEKREIDYQPPKQDRDEGLQFGPAAPKDEARRDKLRSRIMPAFDVLVGFARRIFQVRRREEALAKAEARQKAVAMAQELKAAELRRQANVVAAAMLQADRVPPEPLAGVAFETPGIMTEECFPGAWAIASDTAPDTLRKRLNATTNLELRTAYQATRDAVRLCEDDDGLRARYATGKRVIEMNAADRGFDLETGRQDLKKAKCPEIAQLHRDEFVKPMKVVEKSLHRVRTRGS